MKHTKYFTLPSGNWVIPVIVTVIALTLAGCFKKDYPVVEKPTDVSLKDTTSAPITGGVQRKVLLIGISGVRGDVMKELNIPHIKALLPNAIYSFDALTQAPTFSGPGWSTLLAGVWGNKHGVKNDTYAGNNFFRYPMIFKYIKAINPNLRTISVSASPLVSNNVISHSDLNIQTGNNNGAARDSVVFRLKNDKPDVMVVNFTGADEAGKLRGYDKSVKEYTDAIEQADAYVGDVMQALKSRPDYAKEDWLVIITSDHGGTKAGHGGALYEERNIFTIFHNSKFTSRNVEPPVNSLKAIKFKSIGEYAYSDQTTINFNNYTGFTVQIQMRSPLMTNGNGPVIIGNKNWNSGGNPGWVIYAYGPVLGFNAGDGRGNRIDINASDAPRLDDNKWHFITVTVDRAGDARLYQDGILYKTASMLRISTLDPASAMKLVINDDISRTFGSRYGNIEMTTGNIRIWSKVLSDAAVKKFAGCDTTIDTSSPDYPSLVAWWRGTDGSGNVLEDSGPNNWDMKINNAPVWEQLSVDLCNKDLPPTVPTLVDVAPGVFSWLKINVDPAWRLDGNSWIP